MRSRAESSSSMVVGFVDTASRHLYSPFWSRLVSLGAWSAQTTIGPPFKRPPRFAI